MWEMKVKGEGDKGAGKAQQVKVKMVEKQVWIRWGKQGEAEGERWDSEHEGEK